eukprot:scaffold47932_cov48-Attheya_sp.AAC.1
MADLPQRTIQSRHHASYCGPQAGQTRWMSSNGSNSGGGGNLGYRGSGSGGGGMAKRRQTSRVFVSRHNQSLNVTAAQIVDHCVHQGMALPSLRTTVTHVICKECPFCEKPTNGMADNHYKLYVQIGGGAYMCHRCGAKGSWFDFKRRLNSGNNGNGPTEVTSFQSSSQSSPQSSQHNPNNNGYGGSKAGGAGTAGNGGGKNGRSNHQQGNMSQRNRNSQNNQDHGTHCLPMPSERLAAAYSSALLDAPSAGVKSQSQSAQSQQTVLEYLTDTRGLSKATLRKYGVGKAVYRFPSSHQDGGYEAAECVTFPWILRASEIAEQETLRGATYQFEVDPPPSSTTPVVVDESVSSSDESMKNDDANDDKDEGDEGREQVRREEGPWTTRRIKARAVSNKGWQRLDPAGGGWGLFGWHTVPADATSIVICEGEYDAMAVYQATGKPAVSLPNGCRSLPVEVLPILEKFEEIYLWMDSDGPGQEGAEMFSKKIGLDRCLIVPTFGGCKDANEALLQNQDLNAMLEAAKVMPHESILQFDEIRSQVLHEIFHPDKYVGVPVPSLPSFTKLIKGFRRGEMTVLTGPTGSGKTTFLGQLSLDFADQGVNTLWGSFEIKNTRLMHKLLQQFSREPLPMGKPELQPKLELLADRFAALPLYFMKFHGGSDVDDVIDAMEYATYVHDVEHIILDNMQFMITRNSGGGSFDKFDMQDIAVEKFRKFATERNVHVTLVVHPRKEEEFSKLDISSIYGSAKATQEADSVLILQNDGKRKYVEVKKNRFDGTLGWCPLYFQHSSGRYSEIPDTGVIQKNSPSPTRSASTSTNLSPATPRRIVAPPMAPQQTIKATIKASSSLDRWKGINQ